MAAPTPFKPTDEQLIAYVLGDLPAEQRRAVDAYIAVNKEAAAMIGTLRSVVHTLKTDDSVAPPARVVQQAQAIFRNRAAAAAERPGVLATWIAAVDRMVARLVYDSRLQPAAVRYAETGDRINLTFETEGGEVDLQAERIAEEPAAREVEPSRWRVMGQISEPQPAQHELALVGADSATPIATTMSDEHGAFALQAPRGKYELLIRSGDRAIVLTPIELM